VAHIVKTIHATIEEFNCINQACEALSMQRSQLVQEGVTEAAHKLGFYAGVDELPMRRRPQTWTDAPNRREESASARFSVSYSPTNYELLRTASEYVKASESLFAVGATLRFIANLKKTRSDIPGLSGVKLPAQYSS
jgi:hypothetical protein